MVCLYLCAICALLWTGGVSCGKILTILVVYQFVLKAVVGSRHCGVMQIALSSPDENVLELREGEMVDMMVRP